MPIHSFEVQSAIGVDSDSQRGRVGYWIGSRAGRPLSARAGQEPGPSEVGYCIPSSRRGASQRMRRSTNRALGRVRAIRPGRIVRDGV